MGVKGGKKRPQEEEQKGAGVKGAVKAKGPQHLGKQCRGNR